MNYRQLNAEERSALAALRSVGLSKAEIAPELGRHRSTVGRELKRNAAPHDGWYRSKRAHQRAHARRHRSRRNSQFGRAEWARVEELLKEQWIPEQVSGHLARSEFGIALELTAVGRLLASLEITPQKPLRRAYERDPKAIAQWLAGDYPKLKRRARRHGAMIFFLDEA